MIKVLWSSVLLTACGPVSDYCDITIVNTSDAAITCQITEKKKSDTNDLLVCDVSTIEIKSGGSVNVHNFFYNIHKGDFSNNVYPLRILIMDKEKYNEYSHEPCDTIRKYVPIVDSVILNAEKLQQMNWRFEYSH